MIMKPRNILSLSREEKRDFLDSFDHVFSDIDGVVYNLSHAIEGSAEGFKALQQTGKHFTFITNNSVRSEAECLEKLRANNIEVEADNVMHPAKSVVQYLNSINFEGLIYVMASKEFKNVLLQAGYKVLETSHVILQEYLADVLKNTRDPQPVKAVIIDYDFNLSYLKIMKADYYLRQNDDCLLIGGATDVRLSIAKGETILGCGSFVQMLEQISGKKMLTFGKPGKALAELLMKRFHIQSPRRVLMIGDMLQQDIYFATSCGFQSILVLSGGCSYDELITQTDPKFIPDYYAQSMKDFVEFMKDLKS